MSMQSSHFYEFGPFRLDPSERRLLREGQPPVQLEPKPFQVLVLLIESGGRVVGREELMKTLWPNVFVESGSVDNCVHRLRKALGGGQSYIETVPKLGYRFIHEVRRLPDDRRLPYDSGNVFVLEKHTLTRSVTEEEMRAADEPVEAALLPASESGAAGAGRLRRTRRRPPLALALAVAALCVAGAATAFGVYRLIGQRQSRERSAAGPFSQMSISRLTTSGRVTHAAVSPDGEYFAHVTSDAEGDSLWVRHVAAPTSVRVAGPAATEYVSVTFAPDGDSVYYLTLERDKGHTALYRVPLLGGPSSMAAYNVGPVGFSPDARQITFIRAYGAESRLFVANTDGTDERVLAVRRQPEFFRVDWNAPAWSPDGKTIACQVRLNDGRGRYETVVGVSVEDGSQRPLTSERWYHTGQPAWLADGSGLLVTASERATAPAQVWHISLKSGEANRVTNDLNDYRDLSLTRDSSKLAAVQEHSVSSVWVAPDSDANRARRIASDAGWIQEMAWTPDGRIVYRSNAGGSAELWVMNADGSNPKQLTVDARAGRGLSFSPDGRYIFFASDRAGHSNIWRVDAEGRDLRQLTFGDGELYPNCTPDGEWVVYQRGEREPTLWKVSTGGGEPVQMTKTRAMRPAVSPDGGMIAYHYLEPEAQSSRWRIGVVSSEGGPQLRRFDFPPTLTWRFVRWTPDQQSIAYANNPGGLSDIWLQPLDGGRPRQLTSFKAEQILAFDWSPDGRSLAFVRGVETSDVILIGDEALKRMDAER